MESTVDKPAAPKTSWLARRACAMQSRALEKTKSVEIEWKSSGWVLDDVLSNLEILEDDVEDKKAKLGNERRRQRVEEFKSRLKSNKHYMMSWLGFSTSDDPPVSDVAYFVQNSGKVDEILECLFQSPSNCLRTTTKVTSHIYADDGSVQILVLFFVEAYIAIAYQEGRQGPQIGERWSPDRLIKVGREFAYRLVEQGMAPEYLPGVEFLYKYTSLHNLLAKGKEPQNTETPDDYNPDAEFESLPGKSKALVMDAESLCWSALRTMFPTARDKCLAVLKQMIKLDPDHYEWHYQSGNYLRMSRRRSQQQGHVCIYLEEEMILWETYDKCKYKKFEEDGSDSELKRKAFAGVLQGLAEKIRFRWYSRASDTLTFGDLVFKCDADGVSYIMDGIEKIMAKIDDPESLNSPKYAESIRCGDILSSILPAKYRNYAAAEKYFLHALSKTGTYSKIYHKLGLLYSRAEEMLDITKSLKYLRLCFAVDPTNVPGATDLIKVLMMFPQLHASEINSIIAQTLRSPALSPRDTYTLLFIDGCLQFFLENEEAAIETWFSADKRTLDVQPPVHSVFSLLKSLRNLRWNWGILNQKEILGVVDGVLNTKAHTFSDEKLHFLEKTRLFLSTMGPKQPWFRTNQRGDESADVVQRRARCISEPQIPISEQDGNWRGTTNRCNLDVDTTFSVSSSYKNRNSRTSSINSDGSENHYQKKPNYSADQSSTFERGGYASKRYDSTYISDQKTNSLNNVWSSSQQNNRNIKYFNKNCKSQRSPSPESWR